MSNNPFFNALGGGQMPGSMSGFPQLLQQFKQFKASFKGDPKAEVEKMLQSGKISQDQLNKIQSINNRIVKLGMTFEEAITKPVQENKRNMKARSIYG